MCTFLEGGDPVADERNHHVLIAQPQVLQLLENFVDLVRQDGGLLGDSVPQIRIGRTRSVRAQPDQIFIRAISDIEEGLGLALARIEPRDSGKDRLFPGRDRGSAELCDLLVLRVKLSIRHHILVQTNKPDP